MVHTHSSFTFVNLLTFTTASCSTLPRNRPEWTCCILYVLLGFWYQFLLIVATWCHSWGPWYWSKVRIFLTSSCWFTPMCSPHLHKYPIATLLPEQPWTPVLFVAWSLCKHRDFIHCCPLFCNDKTFCGVQGLLPPSLIPFPKPLLYYLPSVTHTYLSPAHLFFLNLSPSPQPTHIDNFLP